MRTGSVGFLKQLEERLAAGASLMPVGFRTAHAHFIRRQMTGDGGFCGRQGGEDIYYASFGLRAAALVGIDDRDFWRRGAAWLLKHGCQVRNTVECFSTLAAARAVDLQAPGVLGDPFLRDLRKAAAAYLESIAMDGAVPDVPGGKPGLYSTFLAMLSWGYLGLEMPDAEGARRFVLGQRQADGGFSDVHAACSGTNQTAAALSVLAATGDIPEEVRAPAKAFLRSMQREDGGLAAHAAAQAADLLSTFTALVAAVSISALRSVRLSDVARFAKSMMCRNGGFRSTMTDKAADVEYTYYGIGTLALLAGLAVSKEPVAQSFSSDLQYTAAHKSRIKNARWYKMAPLL